MQKIGQKKYRMKEVLLIWNIKKAKTENTMKKT